MNEQLARLETGNRWARDSSRLAETLTKIEDRKRLLELNRLHTMAVDRWFLLMMKKKYAGMYCL